MNQSETATRVFISHNERDKDLARILSAQLKVAGADVWFDEWSIAVGESIPNKINEALQSFDVFVFMWSKHAELSNWVNNELQAAIARKNGGGKFMIVPIPLDDTPLPPLLSHYRRVEMRDANAVMAATMEILGIRSKRELIKALQRGLEATNLPLQQFEGAGVFFGCPSCGADVSALRGGYEPDEEHDRMYCMVHCPECGWNAGSEV